MTPDLGVNIAQTDQPDGPVVDTTIEHTRWGIIIRQNVLPHWPPFKDDEVMYGHRRLMSHGGLTKEFELDLVDHHTGSMLQRMKPRKPVNLLPKDPM